MIAAISWDCSLVKQMKIPSDNIAINASIDILQMDKVTDNRPDIDLQPGLGLWS